jgi:hypothetical protein
MKTKTDERGVEYADGLTLDTLPRGWALCGTCGRAWNDEKSTAWTPAPSARCPFEYEHEHEDENDQTYNGWKNYPTWAVNLWLSNDEGLYQQAVEITRFNVEHQNAADGGFGRGVLAEQLKLWVRDELAPDLGATFAADLLGYALDCVDWYEIADAWIESTVEV